MPDQSEYAELVVNGQIFREWKEVQVTRDTGEKGIVTEFSFIAAEGDSIAPDYSGWQIRPGDKCQVRLGGTLVASGFVNVRETYYDASDHGVMIQGRSDLQDIVDSSAMVPGGQFLKQTFDAIVQSLLKPFGLGYVKEVLTAANRPFREFQVQPGETVFEVVERLARLRGFYLADTPAGDLLVFQGPAGGGGSLVEGDNILAMRATLSDHMLASDVTVYGQQQGDDEIYGEDARDIVASAPGPNVDRYRPLLGIAPEPSTTEDLQDSADQEVAARVAASVEASVTVQGWRDQSGQLWDIRQTVLVRSPMALLDRELMVKRVTWRQGPEGSTTVIDLSGPEAFGGSVGSIGGSPAYKADPLWMSAPPSEVPHIHGEQ